MNAPQDLGAKLDKKRCTKTFYEGAFCFARIHYSNYEGALTRENNQGDSCVIKSVQTVFRSFHGLRISFYDTDQIV